MDRKNRIIIVTGGTGGHIFPARSTALALVEKGFLVTIFGDKNYPKYHKINDSFNYKIIPSSQITKKIFPLIKATIKISSGIILSLIRILIDKPKIIVAFGGYSTFPVLVAAVILGKKIILHEQNAHLGKVNRIFAGYADNIALSYRETSGIEEKYLSKTIFTGNPIRKEIMLLSQNEYRLPLSFETKIAAANDNMGYDLLLASQFNNCEVNKIEDKKLFNILVIGGSGGSQIFSEVLPKAFFNIREEIKNRISIFQQCRKEYLVFTFDQYKNFNLNVVANHFFENMPELIEKSHLIIARSGSSSIAEFTAAKKPMILIPFAKSADNHQEKNADFIQKAGAAIVIKEEKFTINNVTDCLEKLIDNPELLLKMSRHSKECAVLNAADNLAELTINLV